MGPVALAHCIFKRAAGVVDPRRTFVSGVAREIDEPARFLEDYSFPRFLRSNLCVIASGIGVARFSAVLPGWNLLLARHA